MRRAMLQKIGENFFVCDLVGGFIHGYSTARKLRNAYANNCILVRRSSDNTDTQIGFASNELDESALTTFVGANNGMLRRIYDQVGSRNMQQETQSNQPHIVNSGIIVKVSDRVYCGFDGSTDFMSTVEATPISDNDCTIFIVFESQSTTDVKGVFNEVNNANSGHTMSIYSDTRASLFRHSNYRVNASDNYINFPSQQPTSTKRCLILKRSGNDIYGYDENDTLIGTANSSDTFSTDTALNIGRQFLGSIYFGGKISELLINNTALSSGDQTLVLNNIKAYYGI